MRLISGIWQCSGVALMSEKLVEKCSLRLVFPLSLMFMATEKAWPEGTKTWTAK